MGASSLGLAGFVLLIVLAMPQVASGAPPIPCAANDACAPPAVACVDGYCCDRACDGDCAVCNGGVLQIPAATNGTCMPAPRGSHEAACGQYLCSGAHTGCDTTCEGDQYCAEGSYCPNHTCVSKVANGAECPAGCTPTG